MPIVQAIENFDHNGSRTRGKRFPVSDLVARKLRDRGLVSIVGEEEPNHPSSAAGAQSSALPVAQASPQTTAKQFESGEEKPRRKKKAEESSQ